MIIHTMIITIPIFIITISITIISIIIILIMIIIHTIIIITITTITIIVIVIVIVIVILISDSCRCALIGVPCRLSMLSTFSTFANVLFEDKSPRAEGAKTDPPPGHTYEGAQTTA